MLTKSFFSSCLRDLTGEWSCGFITVKWGNSMHGKIVFFPLLITLSCYSPIKSWVIFSQLHARKDIIVRNYRLKPTTHLGWWWVNLAIERFSICAESVSNNNKWIKIWSAHDLHITHVIGLMQSITFLHIFTDHGVGCSRTDGLLGFNTFYCPSIFDCHPRIVVAAMETN